MRTKNIQFHMFILEVLDFAAEMSLRYGLEIELERFFPATTVRVPSGTDLKEAVVGFGHVDRLWFLYQPSHSRRIERFMLNVGRCRNTQLEQSQFGGGTNDVEVYDTLRKVSRDLKARTKAGVWVVGGTGNVGYAKAFRISEGVLHAVRSGEIELTSIGFLQSFRVDNPDQAVKE